ncbi:MAG: hypothetical protein KME64_20035 [Scytonematopsis contorta HA4267-MV1]|jgi:hypothetical protein|nr:hypothetical protein [Scytonematopsis contorta HA4267-MV1]
MGKSGEITIFSVSWLMFLCLFSTSVSAHKVEISGDVAGTWHVEPNHNPKAGETSRAWVALTRKGGTLVPLQQANCQMAVYSQPRKQGDFPILQPPVKAINVEKYENIPGADIVFPNTGIYQLELSCKPKTEASFQAFQMKYDVTVATAATKPPQQLAQSKDNKDNNNKDNSKTNTDEQQMNAPLIAIPAILGLGTLGILLLRGLQRKT